MTDSRPVDAPAASGTLGAAARWFTTDPPCLLGTCCTACGTIYFPPQTLACRNPACDGDDLVDTPLSDHGTIWSYTDARYRPPPPYVSGEEFEPYAVAAVELAAERIVVLGQLVRGVRAADLEVGMEVELAIEELDPGTPVWKWRPRSRPDDERRTPGTDAADAGGPAADGGGPGRGAGGNGRGGHWRGASGRGRHAGGNGPGAHGREER